MKKFMLGSSVVAALLFCGCGGGSNGDDAATTATVSSGQGKVYWADNSLFGVTDPNGNGLDLFDLNNNLVGSINTSGMVVNFGGEDLGYCDAGANASYNEYGALIGECTLSVNKKVAATPAASSGVYTGGGATPAATVTDEGGDIPPEGEGFYEIISDPDLPDGYVFKD